MIEGIFGNLVMIPSIHGIADIAKLTKLQNEMTIAIQLAKFTVAVSDTCFSLVLGNSR